MRTVARPSFHKNLVYVKLLLMLMLVAIQLGLLQTPAYATAWQVWHCDPNTGTSLVEATVVDDTNNRELRGDYDSWYVVDADSSPDQSGYADYKATENSTVEVYGDVNVIITDNTKWVAKRIHLNNGAKLTLWSETGNKDIWGKLSVKTTKDHKAALSVGEGSTLVINGCKVDAYTDTDDAAGIGGDKNMSAGTIIINDGDVYARSKMNAAGIGAGKRGASGGTITINGGAVKSEAHDEDGAGIGGGEGGQGGTITINGGTVVAYGAEAASGIGGGCYSSAGNVTINGGTVTAAGGEDGAGHRRQARCRHRLRLRRAWKERRLAHNHYGWQHYGYRRRERCRHRQWLRDQFARYQHYRHRHRHSGSRWQGRRGHRRRRRWGWRHHHHCRRDGERYGHASRCGHRWWMRPYLRCHRHYQRKHTCRGCLWRRHRNVRVEAL